jgi:hypothetical protein
LAQDFDCKSLLTALSWPNFGANPVNFTLQYVVTDETWKGSRDGPIRSNNIYNGEMYDARMEIAGWSETKFDDSKWPAAVHMDEFNGTEKVCRFRSARF